MLLYVYTVFLYTSMHSYNYSSRIVASLAVCTMQRDFYSYILLLRDVCNRKNGSLLLHRPTHVRAKT